METTTITTSSTVHQDTTDIMIHGILTDITQVTTIHGIEEDTMEDIMEDITEDTMEDTMEDIMIHGTMTLGITTHGSVTHGITDIRDITDTMATTDIQDSMIRSIAICTHTIADGTADGGHTTITEVIMGAGTTSLHTEEIIVHQKVRGFSVVLAQRHRLRTELSPAAVHHQATLQERVQQLHVVHSEPVEPPHRGLHQEGLVQQQTEHLPLRHVLQQLGLQPHETHLYAQAHQARQVEAEVQPEAVTAEAPLREAAQAVVTTEVQLVAATTEAVRAVDIAEVVREAATAEAALEADTVVAAALEAKDKIT